MCARARCPARPHGSRVVQRNRSWSHNLSPVCDMRPHVTWKSQNEIGVVRAAQMVAAEPASFTIHVRIYECPILMLWTMLNVSSWSCSLPTAPCISCNSICFSLCLHGNPQLQSKLCTQHTQCPDQCSKESS